MKKSIIGFVTFMLFTVSAVNLFMEGTVISAEKSVSDNVEHIGIIVENIDDALKKWESILGLKRTWSGERQLKDGNLRVAFLDAGNVNIEFVSSTSPKHPVSRLLKERGESIQHIAFEVKDIETIFSQLRSQGIEFYFGNKIIPGSRGSKVAFIHPKELNGIFVELVEMAK